MKILTIILITLISFISCTTYNPNYMENKTTSERIVDVVILTTFGSIIGASIAIEVMEKRM